MTKITIVSRWDSANVLFECDAPEGLDSGLHMRHALKKATEARAYLRDAYLSDADQWFMSIHKGDTPETNQCSKLAVEWLDELQGLLSLHKSTEDHTA